MELLMNLSLVDFEAVFMKKLSEYFDGSLNMIIMQSIAHITPESA
jgi:hypothetical protein